MQSTFRVQVSKDYLVFASAHFITFKGHQCEALHGSLVTFLEAAIRAGVRIAAGNDGGAPLVPIGDMVGELELYVRHGMTPQAALASATTETARLFGLEDLGLVEVGQRADLLVIERDPLADVAALRGPSAVLVAGVPVWPWGPTYTAATSVPTAARA